VSSRSGYVNDLNAWDTIRWRGAVNSAIKGKRGQAFLREMLKAIDELPVKELIAHELIERDSVCAIGAVGRSRNIVMDDIDPYDSSQIANAFGIAPAMAREISYMNDDEDGFLCKTPEERFIRMRRWIVWQISGES
jgi:hypothetical protein